MMIYMMIILEFAGGGWYRRGIGLLVCGCYMCWVYSNEKIRMYRISEVE